MSENVTAWATVVLCVLTGVYAFLTWRVAQANAAAASHAKDAAEAAIQATTLALGSLTPALRGHLDGDGKWWSPHSYLRVVNEGQTVFVTSAEVIALSRQWGAGEDWVDVPGGKPLELQGTTYPVQLGTSEPCRLRPTITDAEYLSTLGVKSPTRTPITGCRIKIRYSAIPGGPEYSCHLTVPS